MKIISANSVSQGYEKSLQYLYSEGHEESSRNGPVIVAPMPVTTVFLNPPYRVMTDPLRDCNPFFHVMEAIWMLAGRRDVEFVSRFNKRIGQYSDDSEVFNAAYGYRWRNHFGRDQIIDAYEELARDPTSRRCVIAMWDPCRDGTGYSKDYPCNTHIYFRVRKGRADSWLDMTVCNRSNDIYWGLFGANAVHLSMLHELLARSLGMYTGVWRQMSNNFHLYPDNLPRPLKDMVNQYHSYGVECPYMDPMFRLDSCIPVGDKNCHVATFLNACERFCAEPSSGFSIEFIDHVAFPMYRLWETRNRDWLYAIRDFAWRQACEEWLDRRDRK